MVVVVGLTPEWESEGFDRPSLDLPGRQDELIMRVGRVNANTVVVMQSVSEPSFHDTSNYHPLNVLAGRALLSRCLGSTESPGSSKLGIKVMKSATPLQMSSSERSIRPADYLSRSPFVSKTYLPIRTFKARVARFIIEKTSSLVTNITSPGESIHYSPSGKYS